MSDDRDREAAERERDRRAEEAWKELEEKRKRDEEKNREQARINEEARKEWQRRRDMVADLAAGAGRIVVNLLETMHLVDTNPVVRQLGATAIA